MGSIYVPSAFELGHDRDHQARSKSREQHLKVHSRLFLYRAKRRCTSYPSLNIYT